MSAPKLGEYLGVPAHRRERILRDQKYPSVFLQARYSDANTVVRSVLLSGDDVPASLAAKAKLLSGRPMSTKHRADANECCVQAVGLFANIFQHLELKGARPIMTRAEGYPITVEGVTVSVAPTVLLRRESRGGAVEHGALMLVYRKEAALSEHGAEAVAEIMRQALVTAALSGVEPKICIVVDVFSGLVVHASKAHKRIDSEIRSACREIAVRWETLSAA